MAYLSASTFPFGRGDMGRTPVLIQTDLAVNQVVKTGERTSLKFEFSALNVFNQAAVISRVTQMNRASAISSALLLGGANPRGKKVPQDPDGRSHGADRG